MFGFLHIRSNILLVLLSFIAALCDWFRLLVVTSKACYRIPIILLGLISCMPTIYSQKKKNHIWFHNLIIKSTIGRSQSLLDFTSKQRILHQSLYECKVHWILHQNKKFFAKAYECKVLPFNIVGWDVNIVRKPKIRQRTYWYSKDDHSTYVMIHCEAWSKLLSSPPSIS